MTAAALIQTSDPPLTEHELALIEATVGRVTKRRQDCKRAAAQPIAESGIPERRQITLMSIAVAVMNDRGIARWTHDRDFSKYRRR